MQLSSQYHGPRQRIVDAAYQLYSHRGVRDVSIDEVVKLSGVTGAAFAAEFAAIDDLVLAVLEAREQRWTVGRVEAGARAAGTTADEQLLGIFDVFDNWFNDGDFEGCTFINVMLEMGWDHPIGRACIEHLANIRSFVAGLARDADVADPEAFAQCWHILMKGSIIAAAEGDLDAAKRARDMAADLLARSRRPQLRAI